MTVVLPPSVTAPRPPMPRMRSREELDAYLEWLPISWYAENRQEAPYYAGIVATIQWAAGRNARSPIKWKHYADPPNGDNVGGEQAAAYDGMQYGGEFLRDRFHLPADAREMFTLGYCTGVENAASWVTGFPALDVPEGWPWPESFDPRN